MRPRRASRRYDRRSTTRHRSRASRNVVPGYGRPPPPAVRPCRSRTDRHRETGRRNRSKEHLMNADTKHPTASWARRGLAKTGVGIGVAVSVLATAGVATAAPSHAAHPSRAATVVSATNAAAKPYSSVTVSRRVVRAGQRVTISGNGPRTPTPARGSRCSPTRSRPRPASTASPRSAPRSSSTASTRSPRPSATASSRPTTPSPAASTASRSTRWHG